VRLDDADAVRREYATDERLSARAAAHENGEGPDAREVLFDAIAEARPRRFLEVGCGQGWLSERVRRELGAEVVAVDQSEHMVELTRARGVDAWIADVQALPFEDGRFDVVAAAWMLYHVPDVRLALAEIERVLEPGGRLVAVTNARAHLRELYDLVGRERPVVPFHSDDAEELLRERFEPVERKDAFGWTIFATSAEAQAYTDASLSMFGGARVPEQPGPIRVRRAPTIFVAHKRAR
jgi:ubiquinone/menaquinone biosynthesis C-methylase UbiE